jgi:hypothetical protein
MTARRELVLLALLLASCQAWRVPMPAAHVTAHRARALPVFMEEAAEASEEPQPAAEAPAEKAASKSQMPKDFLGFIDVTTGGGSLLASLIVAGGFGLLVEFIKYADPNTASPSIFGSAWS